MGSAIDITPMVPEGTKIITSYGAGQFRVAQEPYQGSIIILPTIVHECDLAFDDGFDQAMIKPIIDTADDFDLLVIGCGDRFLPPSPELRKHLREHSIVLEWMDTGAACRTFNVLIAEGRRVAAALIHIE
jgi:uncharacterized protein